MADTITTIVGRVQNRLGDLVTTRGIDIANVVHREILSHIPELRRIPHSSPTQISLTANTKEYSLTEEIMQVDYVHYRTSSSVATKLAEMGVEELNKIVADWRSAAAGTPTQFYLTANATNGGASMIGFHPTPDTSTSAGYPIVEVFGSKAESSALVAGDTISQLLPHSQVYTEGISYYAAHELRPEAAMAYYNTYMAQLEAAKQYVRTRVEGLKSPPFGNVRK